MELTDIQNRIWDTLRKLKLNAAFNGFEGIKILELIGLTQGQEKLDQILNDSELLLKLSRGYLTPPQFIYNFISDLIRLNKYDAILDPFLTSSSIPIHMNFDNFKSICASPNELEIIRSLFPERNLDSIIGEPINEIEKIQGTFDLIISIPPVGMRPGYLTETKTASDYGTALLLKSARKLSENGKIISILSPTFLTDDRAKSLIRNSGLYVDAVFVIPSGAFEPLTSISANLIVASNQKNERTFVAELSHDQSTNNTILKNFKNKKEGKALQLGAYVNFYDFKSLQALYAEKKMRELVKRVGFPIQFTEISTSINVLKGDLPEEVKHLPNSFYLPKVGNSPVVSSISEMRIRPKNYFQIQIDETKANAIYVANYFNTEIGKQLRATLEAGTSIPQISKSQLSKCVLYLPDLNTQGVLVELNSKIQQFNLRLDELKRSLWKEPKNHIKIAKELKNINQEEKLETWIDNLPFPISSILWRYYATKEDGKKVEHLFHFFEAFSEFLSMIILSAFIQDKEFYKKECHNWIDKNEKFKEWYLRATFGNWNNLFANLSKALRKYLSENATKEFCQSLFGNPSISFLEMLGKKEILQVLVQVSVLRNKWKGHGGITSDDENRQRVITLEQHLNEMRQSIGDGFDETRMLSPGKNSYEDGLYTFSAKELVGVRTPFNETEIKSTIPLDRKRLYLSHANQIKPLELIPFIKYVEASDAIYFYTSIESKDVRWVSYHFEKESEMKQPADNELFKTFEFLKPID